VALGQCGPGGRIGVDRIRLVRASDGSACSVESPPRRPSPSLEGAGSKRRRRSRLPQCRPPAAGRRREGTQPGPHTRLTSRGNCASPSCLPLLSITAPWWVSACVSTPPMTSPGFIVVMDMLSPVRTRPLRQAEKTFIGASVQAPMRSYLPGQPLCSNPPKPTNQIEGTTASHRVSQTRTGVLQVSTAGGGGNVGVEELFELFA
jgi:hypothetical protein